MTEAPLGRRAKITGRGALAVVAGAAALIIAIALVASRGSDESSSGGTSSPTSTEAPTTTAAGILVTVAGNVTKIVDADHFAINDGHTDYTIVISQATKLVNIDGGPMTADAIAVAGLVQVTGTVDGSTIDAQTIVLPTPQTPATSPPASASSSPETSQP